MNSGILCSNLESPLLREFQVDMGVRFGLRGPQQELLRLSWRSTSLQLLPEEAEGVC